jgi:hypothetical protein
MTELSIENNPWSEVGWKEQTNEWITKELIYRENTLKGPVEEVQSTIWSYVSKVSTSTGYYYFKAVTTSLGHEVPLTALLAEIVPTFVPEVVVADTQRNWLLLRDGGQTLGSVTRADKDMTRWEEMVRHLAHLQIQVVEQKERLLATGIFDRRLHVLPQLYIKALENTPLLLIGEGGLREGELEQLRAFAPQVWAMCEKLATYRVPETLHHDDLGAGNILLNGECYLFFDWSESAVAHPFFTLMIVLRYVEVVLKCGEETLECITSAYLSCWIEYEPMERLREAFTLALRLAKLCRSLSWQHILGHLAPEQRGESADSFPYWLQVFLGTEE